MSQTSGIIGKNVFKLFIKINAQIYTFGLCNTFIFVEYKTLYISWYNGTDVVSHRFFSSCTNCLFRWPPKNDLSGYRTEDVGGHLTGFFLPIHMFKKVWFFFFFFFFFFKSFSSIMKNADGSSLSGYCKK